LHAKSPTFRAAKLKGFTVSPSDKISHSACFTSTSYEKSSN